MFQPLTLSQIRNRLGRMRRMAKLHILLMAAALTGAAFGDQPRAAGQGQPGASVATDSRAPAAEPSSLDIPRLRELLNSRQQPQEQSQAALLLVESESPEAVGLVAEGLQRWDRPDVFQSLATAIRLRRDRRFQGALLKALAAEQPAIRQPATEPLARLE